MNQKNLSGKILAAPIAIGALVVLIAIGIYFSYVIYQSKQVEEVETPTAIAEPSDTSGSSNTSSSSLPAEPSSPSTTDETADWLTYTSDRYGFEFKYPKGWSLAGDLEKYLTLENPNDCYRWSTDANELNPSCFENVFISLIQNKYNASDARTYLKEYFDKEINPNSDKELRFNDFYENFSQRQINGKELYQFTTVATIDGSKNPTYWSKFSDGNFLSIEVRFIRDKERKMKTIDQILASFKFTD